MFDRLFDFLSEIWDWLVPWVVVDEYERGVVLRLGKFHRQVGPGLCWLLPLGIDRAITANAVLTTTNLPSQSLTTADGISIAVSGVVSWSIRNVRTFLLRVEDADDVLADSTLGILRTTVSRATWKHLAESNEVDKEVTAAVSERATRWGIDVSGVVLADLAKAHTIRLIQD